MNVANWETVSLGNLFSIENGFAFKSADFQETGIPVIKIKNVKAGYFSKHDFSYVASSYLNKRANKVARYGDILISMSGNRHDGSPETWVGKVTLFKEGEPYLINQRVGALRPKFDDIDPDFYGYMLSSWSFQNHFIAVATSSGGQANLNPDQILSVEVVNPPLSEQVNISKALSLLDDKIDLNRQMNATLETMAQAIFKDWFVDFGPTQRKAEGETDPVKIFGGLIPDPAKATSIADLFPDSFNGDGLPQGWDNKPIGDLVDTGGGATPRTKDLVYWEPATHHWATPKDLSGMQDLALWDTSRKISSEGLAKISSGLNPVGTVLLSSRAPIGYVAIAQVPVAVNQGFITLRPTGAISSSFLYLWCHAYMPAIKSNANGSTFQEISKKNFRPILTAVPNDDAVLEAFVEIVDPLIAKIVANAKENQTLAETRDYLLPKLMSGEVRVGDAASEASNVVGMDKDLFGRKHLPDDQATERDAVMVAAIIDLFDSDGFVVGNFRYQKGVYFLKRYLDLPQITTTKQAAGPYDSALRYEGGHKIAKDRRYIREALVNGKTGNKRGSKITDAKAQVNKFELAEGLKWVENNLRFKSNDELECLATVDFAMNELRARGSTITVDAIIQDINRDDVWRPKLTKAHFRRDKIRDAIAELNKLFGAV